MNLEGFKTTHRNSSSITNEKGNKQMGKTIKFSSCLFWSLLERDSSLLTHGRDDGDQQVLTLVEGGLKGLTQITLWGSDIVLGVTVLGHQVQETVINVQQLELGSLNERNFHIVSRWRQILHLLLGEDVGSDQVDLSVTVLTSLGGGHVDNLTWTTLDDNETVLSQGGTLHWVGQGGTGIGLLENVLFFSHLLSVIGFL
jgi:hypothetical protein